MHERGWICPRILVIAIAAIIGWNVAATTAFAQRVDASYAPFARNRVALSVGAGISATSRTTYLRLGLGIGYFVTDGLELGVGTDLWLLDEPTVVNVTPGLTYVFYQVPVLKPYVGGFYRHAFVFEDFPDLDSLGARAGAYFVTGQAYLGAGLVYEHWLDCSDTTFTSCDSIYPELVLAFTF